MKQSAQIFVGIVLLLGSLAANNGLIVRPNDGANYVNVRMSSPSDLHGSAENVTLEVTYH